MKKKPPILENLRVRSAMKPPAQIANPCATSIRPEVQIFIDAVKIFIEKNKSNYFGAVLELQFLYGLRITECLNISGLDVGFDLSLRIRGLKRSADRIVFSVKCSLFWQGFKGNNFSLGSVYSRFHFYRLYKHHGISLSLVNSELLSVTHSFRHARVLSFLDENLPKAEISKFLGHKSFNSLIHYEKAIK